LLTVRPCRARFPKIVGQGEITELGTQGLQIHRRVCRCGLLRSEHIGRPVGELRLPPGDLVGMDVEKLRQNGRASYFNCKKYDGLPPEMWRLKHLKAGKL
jgi:hypothetical protein